MSRIHEAIRRAERENPNGKSVVPGMRQALSEFIKGEIFSTRPAEQERLKGKARLIEPKPKVESKVNSDTFPLPIAHEFRLVSILAPKSAPSEQYRALKAKFYRVRNERRLKSILVTSAAPAEGKTLTAVNLALTFAQEIDKKVLLIDCDLRRPSVHKLIGLDQPQGLTDFLEKKIPSSEAIVVTRISNFSVMPAGRIPENPAELLNTEVMRDFVTASSEQYDWVILDSPPLIPLADTEMISSMVDGIMLVVRANQTPASLITNCIDRLKGKNILGFVFNGSKLSQKSKYYYHYEYSNESPKL